MIFKIKIAIKVVLFQ